MSVQSLHTEQSGGIEKKKPFGQSTSGLVEGRQGSEYLRCDRAGV